MAEQTDTFWISDGDGQPVELHRDFVFWRLMDDVRKLQTENDVLRSLGGRVGEVVRAELRNAAKNGHGSGEPPQLLTRVRAAAYLGVSRKQIISLEQEGKITGIRRQVKDADTRRKRTGRTTPRLYAKDDLDRYVRLVKGE